MLKDMDKYRLVWQSSLTRKQKVDRYYSLVVARALWRVHLLTLLPADFAYLEYVHVRCLRQMLNRRSAYWSRISNEDIRRQAAAPNFTSQIRLRQLIYFGKLLRRDATHPDRLACFEPRSDLRPRKPTGTHRRMGRPRKLWEEPILTEIEQLAQNKPDWQDRVERLCRSL